MNLLMKRGIVTQMVAQVSLISDIETRFRSCTNPPPLFLGSDCDESPNEERDCNTNGCPGNILLLSIDPIVAGKGFFKLLRSTVRNKCVLL